jgi:hypothetical protein
MIIVDFGKFGKARITRPTFLEVVALLAVFAFVGITVWALR